MDFSVAPTVVGEPPTPSPDFSDPATTVEARPPLSQADVHHKFMHDQMDSMDVDAFSAWSERTVARQSSYQRSAAKHSAQRAARRTEAREVAEGRAAAVWEAKTRKEAEANARRAESLARSAEAQARKAAKERARRVAQAEAQARKAARIEAQAREAARSEARARKAAEVQARKAARSKTSKVRLGDGATVTSAAFIKLLEEHSNAELADKVGLTPRQVLNAMKTAVRGESRRLGVPVEDVRRELDETREANGTLSTRQLNMNHRRARREVEMMGAAGEVTTLPEDRTADEEMAARGEDSSSGAEIMDFREDDEEGLGARIEIWRPASVFLAPLPVRVGPRHVQILEKVAAMEQAADRMMLD